MRGPSLIPASKKPAQSGLPIIWSRCGRSAPRRPRWLTGSTLRKWPKRKSTASKAHGDGRLTELDECPGSDQGTSGCDNTRHTSGVLPILFERRDERRLASRTRVRRRPPRRRAVLGELLRCKLVTQRIQIARKAERLRTGERNGGHRAYSHLKPATKIAKYLRIPPQAKAWRLVGLTEAFLASRFFSWQICRGARSRLRSGLRRPPTRRHWSPNAKAPRLDRPARILPGAKGATTIDR